MKWILLFYCYYIYLAKLKNAKLKYETQFKRTRTENNAQGKPQLWFYMYIHLIDLTTPFISTEKKFRWFEKILKPFYLLYFVAIQLSFNIIVQLPHRQKRTLFQRGNPTVAISP